jgi:hypothetical protein
VKQLQQKGLHFVCSPFCCRALDIFLCCLKGSIVQMVFYIVVNTFCIVLFSKKQYFPNNLLVRHTHALFLLEIMVEYGWIIILLKLDFWKESIRVSYD